MKNQLTQILSEALKGLPADVLPGNLDLPQPTLERARDTRFGDYACNIAMVLAKQAKTNPRQLAQAIVEAIPSSEVLSKVEIAGPGFINLTLASSALHREIASVLSQGEEYGHSNIGGGQKILLEFVSANPTGPLHVGHGRHAAYGDSLGNILSATGHAVTREYYVNDAGRQMDILATSVWLRYLESSGENLQFPLAGYQGGYIEAIAKTLNDDEVSFSGESQELYAGVPADGKPGLSDKEHPENKAAKDGHIDALVSNAKALLGPRYDKVKAVAVEAILSDIENDLEEFGVHMDRYYSEKQLVDNQLIDQSIEQLQQKGLVVEQDGALWFKATEFGDEKDRVVVRKNGQTTYIASDIAYHFEKRERGFDVLLDVLGADHHGYVARTRAGLEAMGEDPESLEVRLVQFVALYRGGQKTQMSTRSGEFDTLRDLRKEVGNDAARFFYVMRSNDQHLDFDLDLAKSKQDDNPVYYIGYAHARSCSLMAKLPERGLDWDKEAGIDALDTLDTEQERTLMSTLSRYPEMVELAAKNRAPQHLVHYLKDVANEFHGYYWAHKILEDQDAPRRNARIALFQATRQVISNGLGLLGVQAPEQM